MIIDVLLVLLVLAMLLFVITVIMNDLCFDRIWNYMEHWEGVAARAGMTLMHVPGGRDESPCEAEFRIEGRLARVTCKSWKMLRLLRKLKSGQLREEELMSMSRWPSTRIPR